MTKKNLNFWQVEESVYTLVRVGTDQFILPNNFLLNNFVNSRYFTRLTFSYTCAENQTNFHLSAPLTFHVNTLFS